jgi:serine phosphatase RsbU (regulator of sigma subunit)
MKERLVFLYQRLSLIQKLSIPLVLSLLFGILLTTMIVKQVSIIHENTMLLKDELIPILEKSTNNRALLKKISENFTFAILASEEDMLSENHDNDIIEKNLKDIISNEKLSLEHAKLCQKSFSNYLTVATTFALSLINESGVNNDVVSMNILLKKYNEVEKDFLQLNNEINSAISKRTAIIKKTSEEASYFTIIYVILFSIILFFISIIIYKDFNTRINNLSRSLDTLGLQKNLITKDDNLSLLSKNIKQTIKDYSIIESQGKELARINRDINDSIEYASFIQEAILPSTDILKNYGQDYFIYWQPRDTVGGDIYFVSELKSKNEIIVMVIDGVGHGVSGAFLTILVKAIKTQIIAEIDSGFLDPSPAKILQYFNKSIKDMLKQDKNSKSNTGFDGGVLYYNKATNICKYAGAKTPLYVIKNNKIEIIKSDRKNVGFVRTDINQKYTEHEINIKKGTKLYITTDGIIDQEGLQNTIYGKNKFQNLLLDNHRKDFSTQKELLKESLVIFKSSCKQSDDITIFGMEF